MFNVLWNILLGIVGGIISSVIVSRVFFIQGEYQQQTKFVDGIIRKLATIRAYLSVCKSVFEVSYDEDIRIEKEMKDKGYRYEMEYYAAHKDKNWISVKDLLDKFKSTLLKVVETAEDEIANSNVTDKYLAEILCDISNYLHDISSTKELNFSALNRFEKSERLIFEKYDKSKHISGKQLLKLVVKDKVMIVLYILLCLIIAATVFSFALGI